MLDGLRLSLRRGLASDVDHVAHSRPVVNTRPIALLSGRSYVGRRVTMKQAATTLPGDRPHASRGPVGALPIRRPQTASTLRETSQVEPPDESKLVGLSGWAVAQRPNGRRPWRPAGQRRRERFRDAYTVLSDACG